MFAISIENYLIPYGIMAGLFGTYLMDLHAKTLLSRRLVDLQDLQFGPAILGRWFLYLSQTKSFFVSDLRSVSPYPLETRVGLLLHYGIGAVLGGFFFLLLPTGLSELEIVLAGVLYGALTNVFPWLLMFPSMGFGIMASHLPMRIAILKLSFFNHLVFGLSLGLAHLLISLF